MSRAALAPGRARLSIILVEAIIFGNWPGHRTNDLRQFWPYSRTFIPDHISSPFPMFKTRRKPAWHYGFNGSSRRGIRWFSIGICAFGLLVCGCTESQRATIMGTGFNDDFSKGNQNLRPKDGDGNYDGVSTKSQQIEHDLGV
jgi:hypothetical protein